MTAAEIYARFPQLETENLFLRRLSPSDAPAVLRIFGDDAVTRYYDLVQRLRSSARDFGNLRFPNEGMPFSLLLPGVLFC